MTTIDPAPLARPAAAAAPPVHLPAASAGAPPAHAAAAPRRGSEQRPPLRGVAAMLTAGLSNQLGAGLGANAFPVLGPAGVVAVRHLVAASILLPIARPRFRTMTWAQWWPTLTLAAVFGLMNLTLYHAIERIGLGLAVTLEFLGPLAVALASSRSRRDVALALLAGAGVYLLVLPGSSTDHLGVALALVAAACWAAYIVLNRVVGGRLSGVQAPAIASLVNAVVYLPVLVVVALQGRLGLVAVAFAAAAGVFATVVPFALDLTALRIVPQRFFGQFMSVHPVLAALVGIVLLQQLPAGHEWAGIGLIVAANAMAATRRG
jgi:inner membrane transporter RhtA